jgi:nucleoside-diphosphate-sugar epimerase
VTGASGFVGIYLVKKLLSEGYRVRALVRKNSLHTGRLLPLPVELVEGDLADADTVNEAARDVEYIFHLGAAMSNDWDEHERTTIGGTEHVIAAAKANGVKRLVHVSTLAVYELLDKPARSIIRENSPYQTDPKKLGPYAWAKIETEKAVKKAVEEQQLDAVIVRLGMVLGPLSRVFYPHLGYSLGDDVFIPIARGRVILPLVYVDNAVDGLLAAALKDDIAGESFNLVDEGEVSAMEFLKKFKDVTGSDAKIVSMPYFVAWSLTLAYEIVSGIGLIKKGATSRAQLKWKQSSMFYDSSKARETLDWQSPVSLEEGMKRTFEWYRDKYGV